MDVNKAKSLSVLVNKQQRYEAMLDCMASGYSDEWEFKNSHTGTTVDFSCDDWAEIRSMILREYNEVTMKIESF